MNIFLCGSDQLTALDQEEIKKFLIDYAHKHKICILCYKSIENEVLRFFIENERLAQNLCFYTLQPLHVLTDEFQEVVDYLKKHGAEYIAFDHPSNSIYRSDYMFFVKQIVEDTDLVLCFYKGINIRLSFLLTLQKKQELMLLFMIYLAYMKSS